MAEWSGQPVSLPAICRLRVRFPSPPGHVTLPTTGASMTASVLFGFTDGIVHIRVLLNEYTGDVGEN